VSVIDAALKSGVYADRGDRLEPPYMAPSTDPNLYSSVCIFPTHITQLCLYF
jgi:hypothetical protein